MSRREAAPADDVANSSRPIPAGPVGDDERLLAAIDRASAAGEWAIVAQLSEELRARRLAAVAVVDLAEVRRSRR